jgi:uncharacterized phage protein (TIGR02220 family)
LPDTISPVGLNLNTGKKFKGDPESLSEFEIRLSDGYTLEDIETAIINCHANDYHQKNPHHLTPEFILRKVMLEKYLNARPKNNGSANVNNMVY